MPDISAKKILIIQTYELGDVLLTTSYLEALRQKFPNAIIDFLVAEKCKIVLEGNPLINNIRVCVMKKSKNYFLRRLSLLTRIFFANYRLVIDHTANGGSRVMVLLSHAKYRVGWSDVRFASFLYNLKAPPRRDCYIALRHFDLLRRTIGIQEMPFKLHLYIKEKSERKADAWLLANNINPEDLIIFAPGARCPGKAWNTVRFAALADMIIERYNLKAAIVWAPDEFDIAQKMKNSMKKDILICEKTTFNEAAAFVRKARLLICNDGGLNHVSVAADTPSLAIFGGTKSHYWSPQGAVEYHYHLQNAEFAKNPRNFEDRSSFGITPEEAFEKVGRIFEELELKQPSAT
ncbi:MAG: glycosyltransferase family 9 protein [Chitinispirillales bacterium]|jgi:ADP-heptose:LPS heptosyltransferase|nr:glycosyltransferase family 9 protein [Chitinispirillales bacterium]